MIWRVPFVDVVLVDLAVEGKGPCEEVNPADDIDYQTLPLLHMLL